MCEVLSAFQETALLGELGIQTGEKSLWSSSRTCSNIYPTAHY